MFGLICTRCSIFQTENTHKLSKKSLLNCQMNMITMISAYYKNKKCIEFSRQMQHTKEGLDNVCEGPSDVAQVVLILLVRPDDFSLLSASKTWTGVP